MVCELSKDWCGGRRWQEVGRQVGSPGLEDGQACGCDKDASVYKVHMRRVMVLGNGIQVGRAAQLAEESRLLACRIRAAQLERLLDLPMEVLHQNGQLCTPCWLSINV